MSVCPTGRHVLGLTLEVLILYLACVSVTHIEAVLIIYMGCIVALYIGFKTPYASEKVLYE